MQQLRARFEGRVQGVGFRMTVADIAASFEVAGRVCNMRDGSVHLLAQGERVELERFHQAIMLRMSRNVVAHHENWTEMQSGCLLTFEICSDDSL